MICKVAGLTVDVPELGDLSERCAHYFSDGIPDIVIDGSTIKPDLYPEMSVNDNYYLTTGFRFYRELLLRFNGMMLHSSAVLLDNYGYLFSGPCGIGKSTHTALWKKAFGDKAVIINDDKPAIRRIDGKWFVYGTPWCGKDGINVNTSAPLAGICFLHRGDTLIREVPPLKALPQILRQTNGRANEEQATKLTELLNYLIEEIPIFEFYNHAQPNDALITYGAMKQAIELKEKIK